MSPPAGVGKADETWSKAILFFETMALTPTRTPVAVSIDLPTTPVSDEISGDRIALISLSGTAPPRFLLPPANLFGNLLSPVNTRLFLLLPVIALMAACHTPYKERAEVPLTLKNFPAAYSEYAVELADTNIDGGITMAEWINAGGDRRSFLLTDENKDGIVTRTELVRISDKAQFLDFTRRYADLNRDNQLTRQEFRSASGVQVLRFAF